ncbi:MAG: DUF2244 domain-containing protein [Betaproteobacteria bacterium]|uniref:DUF2244 domain-containing protein n=1 Tax=Candidatus Proximibacter danicus TaxID=2954365 RepID=A0A9D7K0X0_9PROT|nr:DUF2244 domain-containing protein [Candidatus Proximibacter danicus]
MALLVRETLSGQAWVARRNPMLSSLQARRLTLAAAGISGGIALIFSAFGAWPVLPFAGIEIGALWLALRHLQRQAGDEERIDIDATTIRVTRRSEDRCDQDEFSRYWARLRVDRPPDKQTFRLFLRSHGRETEIGRLLTDTQKIVLEKDLRKHLGT